MKQMPGTFRGAVEERARRMAGWTGRQPHETAKPHIYRILRLGIPRSRCVRLPK